MKTKLGFGCILNDILSGYAYLWLEDRDTLMQQFLEYSRALAMEEIDMVLALDPKAPPKNPPKMEQFREQIDLYENVYTEVEEMSSSKIFCNWFRVDLKPFRQSLLNTICKWSSMFKKHLVERVTTSLSDLGSFIRYGLSKISVIKWKFELTTLINFLDALMKVFCNKFSQVITMVL